MHVAPSSETSRTATVVFEGCRSASVTSGASSLGAHAGGNRNRGGAGGSESIMAESQVAYGTGCRAVDDGCGPCSASARLQCAQTPHVKQTQHTDGTRGHFAEHTNITTCVCARIAPLFFAKSTQSLSPMASQVFWLVLLREIAQEDQVGRQRHHHVQSCLKHTRDARRGLWASGEDHLCDELGH